MNEEIQNLLPPISDGLTTTARTRPATNRSPIAKITSRIADSTSKTAQSVGRAVDGFLGIFAPQTALNRMMARLNAQAITRSWDAANPSRLNADVDFQRTDSDSALRSKRIRLMAHGREEQRNDPFYQNGIRVIRNNVIGDDRSEEGISIHADIKKKNGEPDDAANKIINDMWAQDKKKIDLNGRWQFNDLMSIASNSLIGNGEVLAIIHEVGALGSDLPFSIEIIETDQLPTSNEMWSSGAYAPFAPIKNEKGETTGYLLDGIEYDNQRRIVAYHVLQFHPGNEFLFQPLQTKRVPIQRVIHYFEPNRAGAARGAPWAVSGLDSISNSNDLIKSELLAARMQSKFPMHFETIPSANPFNAAGSQAPVLDSDGNPVYEVQTGMYTYGPSKPTMMKNERVNSQFIPFMEFEAMRGGASMGLSKSSYARDSKGLNFSSLREDKTEDRRGYRCQQGLHSRYFIDKFWPSYIRALVLANRIPVNSIAEYKRWCGMEAEMPDWGYVNPEQEIKADAMAVAIGKKMPSDLFGRGHYKDRIDTIAEQVEYAKSKGLTFAWMEGEMPGSKKSSGNDDSVEEVQAKSKKGKAA